MADSTISSPLQTGKPEHGFVRAIGLFDGTMIVVGSMIGSGIFIVAAEISRVTGSAGGLLLTWFLTGLLTIAAALSYGELAALFPHAGGQYIYLREAYSPLWGFLYGWTLFLVIQTGTIAAVAVAFARYLGVLLPVISPQTWVIRPINLGSSFAVSLSECVHFGEDAVAARPDCLVRVCCAQRFGDRQQFFASLGDSRRATH